MRCSLIDKIGEDYLVFDCIIKHDKWGITSQDMSQVLKISISKVRKSVKRLKDGGWIDMYAEWYGRNMGYKRKYRMSEKSRRIEEEHALRCPWCREDLTDDSEFKEDLITYHGEDGSIKKECPNCGQEFWVEEHVDRTWEVGNELDENRDVVNNVDDDKRLQRELEVSNEL